MLETPIRRYQNRTIEAAQIIAELIELAKQMRKARSVAVALNRHLTPALFPVEAERENCFVER